MKYSCFWASHGVYRLDYLRKYSKNQETILIKSFSNESTSPHPAPANLNPLKPTT